MTVPCGRCRLCRKRVANDWLIRLYNEFQETPKHRHCGMMQPRVVFATFTFAEKFYTDDDSLFPSFLVRFRDNYRKRYGKSPRYWAVTDRGAKNGRLHLHMFLFNPYDYKKQRNIPVTELHDCKCWWPYGITEFEWIRKGDASAIYAVGYITMSNLDKDAKKHGCTMCEKAQKHKPVVYPSKGIGKAYDTLENRTRYKDGEHLVSLGQYTYGVPRYYRYKWTSRYERYLDRRLYEAERLSTYETCGEDFAYISYFFPTLIEWESAAQSGAFPVSHTFEFMRKHYGIGLLQHQINDVRRFDAEICSQEQLTASEIDPNENFYLRPWENSWFPFGDLTINSNFPF